MKIKYGNFPEMISTTYMSVNPPNLPENTMITTNLTINLPDIGASATFATYLAQELHRVRVLALYGDLGSGKTFLCQEVIRNIVGKHIPVTSPTFTILQTYPVNDYVIYHYDLYRINNIGELEELDLAAALTYNLCLIEWPQIARHLLPDTRLELQLVGSGHDERKCYLTYHGISPIPYLVDLANNNL